MTDRLKGVLVTFEDDIREDDAEARIAAIKQIRGVLSVSPLVTDYDDYMARDRVRHELGQRLIEVLYPKEATNAKR